MRREDRARDADFAWAVFDQASHSVLSMRDGEGGYGVPISPARVGQRVYFHCALEGKKRACLAAWPEVRMVSKPSSAASSSPSQGSRHRSKAR